MKISIGTNIHGNCSRQSHAIETHQVLQSRYSDIVKLYAFQRDKDIKIPETHKRVLLSRDSRDFVEGGKKTSPCLKDILDGLAETDCTYMVYTNSDILLSDCFMKYILDNDFTGYSCSRMDINPIQSIKEKLIPYRYEVAGQDVFVMKKDWYIKHRNIIKDYLIGSIWFDTALTCILKQYGNNDPIVNGYPVQIAHVFHGWGSGSTCPENTYNTKLYESEISQLREPWGWFYHNILINRPNGFNMFTQLPNEKEIEKEHFGKHMLTI